MDIFGFILDLAKDFGLLNAIATAAIGFFIHSTNKANKITIATFQKIIEDQAVQLDKTQMAHLESAITLKNLIRDTFEQSQAVTAMIKLQDDEMKRLDRGLESIKNLLGQNKVGISNINTKLHELSGVMRGSVDIIERLMLRQKKGGDE